MLSFMQKKLVVEKYINRIQDHKETGRKFRKILSDPTKYHGQVEYVRQSHGVRLWSEYFTAVDENLDRGIALCIPGTGESAMFYDIGFVEELRNMGLRVVR